MTLKAVIDKTDQPGGPEGCWNWTGGTAGKKRNRGVIRYDGVMQYVHRLLYEELIGPIPNGMELDHLCRRPICCNPLHLEPVTQGEHFRRHPNPNADKTHCIHGHEFTPDNIYRDPSHPGKRFCRACRKRREDARKAKGG